MVKSVNHTLSDAEMLCLKEIKKEGISEYCHDDLNWHHIFITPTSRVFSITETSEQYLQDMEHSRFVIEEKDSDFLNTSPYSTNKKRVNNKIVDVPFEWNRKRLLLSNPDIFIYRDNITTESCANTIRFMSDIAIRFSGCGEELLLILMDMPHFIPAFHNSGKDSEVLIDKYWSKGKWGFCGENLVEFNREIINI